MSLVAMVLSLVGGVDAAMESRAALHAHSLLQASEAYSLHPANKEGRYPVTVADLAKPPFAKDTTFVKNKEKDLMDPWGAFYRCRTDLDERRAVRFYVWTERAVNGKVRKLGYPPPEKK
jgi:hypothetical protein